MPKKGRRKDQRGGSASRKPVDALDPTLEDDVADCGRSMETMSIMSTASDTKTDCSDETGEVDESSSQDLLEDKLLECIEGITQKSVKGRVDSLNSLKAGMTKKLLTDFLSTRKLEVACGLARCIQKGKQEEQCAASVCGVLLMLQMGSCADSNAAIQELYDVMGQPLRTVLNDNTASSIARAACAEALGLLCFLADQEFQVCIELMDSLEQIFKLSYHKGDGTIRQHTADVSTLHSSALSAWALLITNAAQSTVNRLIQSHLGRLAELLTSPDVELRISAGEAIALLYELARDSDEEWEPDCQDTLCVTLKSLATECSKFRAKKDRKQQRSSFRDILSFVEQDLFTTDVIKISAYEKLSLNCWTTRIRYNSLCHIIGSGMKKHLQENEYLREVFGLGPALLPGTAGRSTSKEDRHFQHGAAFKVRTRSRAKQRDRKAYTHAASYD